MSVGPRKSASVPRSGGATATQRMISVVRTRQIAAAPEAIFALLADPARLSRLLPRVERVELLERGANRARVATYMSFGPFGSIRNEGEVRWDGTSELVFSTATPIPVESRWTLHAIPGGTEVTTTLELDLTPLLGPLAAFVPPERVTAMIEPDLDGALAALAREVGG